jgi:competence protein ComEC
MVVAAILGLAASYFSFSLWIVFFVFLFVIWLLWKPIHLIVYCLCVFTGYYVLLEFTKVEYTTKLAPTIGGFYGTISTIPLIDGNRLAFEFETSYDEKVLVEYKIRSLDEKIKLNDLRYGMQCTFKGSLNEIDGARNFYAFDYKKYLFFKDIYWTVSPNDSLVNKCVLAKRSIIDRIISIREMGIHYINQHFTSESAGIVQALIFGERRMINEDTLRLYQVLGLVHLLAISGLHVGFLTGGIFFIGIRLGVPRELMLWILLCSLPLYMIIAGTAPSVMRSCLMTMLVIVSLKLQTKFTPLDAVSLTCLLLLLINPFLLFQPGFQLSFVVSTVLILSSKKIITVFPHRFLQLVFVSLIAQLASLPIMFYHFFEVSLLSIFANLLFVPFFTFIILPLSIVALLTHLLIPPLGPLIISLLTFLLQLSNVVLLFVPDFKPFQLILGRPSTFVLVLYFFATLVTFKESENLFRSRRCRISILSIFIVIFIHWLTPYFSKEGEVVFLDVGQGDSIFIELPFRKAVYLIDTGGLIPLGVEEWEERKNTFSVGEDVVTPFLKAKGIRTIDRLLLTHPDMDHIGASLEILHEINIQKLSISWDDSVEGFGDQLLTEFRRKEIPIESLKQGDGWEIGNYQFYVISPPVDRENDKNNKSIVLYTTLGGLSWIFTGDIEGEGEQNITKSYPGLSSNVLKVGHHGSATSTTSDFLDQINPKVAIISVGKSNFYGHPHPKVIQELESQNIVILRTDKHGAIRYTFNENRGTFETVIPYYKEK